MKRNGTKTGTLGGYPPFFPYTAGGDRDIVGRAAFFVDAGATSFLIEVKALAIAVKTMRKFQDELNLAQRPTQ